jgi:energy-coupling factor transporter ATP-binding protein EcfA2
MSGDANPPYESVPPGQLPLPLPIPPTIKPLRIKSLTLNDFRAFAGPGPVKVELNSKNLLVYGENGAGKSSIFHAIDEFFSGALPNALARRQRLMMLKNIFSKAPDDDVFVEVEMDDGIVPARWSKQSHPVDTYPQADARVVNGAYRKAALDYRSLLDTNYRHGSGVVNLFDLSMRVLLRDYPALHNGREERIVDLWRRMEPMPAMQRMWEADKTNIQALAASLNAALSEALEALTPKANAILTDLGWGDVELESLTMPGVRFEWQRLRRNRRYVGLEVTPKLKFRGEELAFPQTFLNEARLSALALAIYFAGRQVCAATLQTDTPRIMLLDDVLIGLDQSNRLPVLQLLDKYFHDWQIVLLTHDRVWFEMARFHLADRGDWNSLELFEEIEPTGGSRPVLRPQNIDAVASNLTIARKFFAAREYPASAVHARVAFELSMKKLCDEKSIAVRFHLDPRKTSSEELLNAIDLWLKAPKRATIKATIDPAIAQIKMWRKVVLNPFSHSTPVNLAANEVDGAIDAVEALHAVFKPLIKDVNA